MPVKHCGVLVDPSRPLCTQSLQDNLGWDICYTKPNIFYLGDWGVTQCIWSTLEEQILPFLCEKSSKSTALPSSSSKLFLTSTAYLACMEFKSITLGFS